jgi:hypothetical protein
MKASQVFLYGEIPNLLCTFLWLLFAIAPICLLTCLPTRLCASEDMDQVLFVFVSPVLITLPAIQQELNKCLG